MVEEKTLISVIVPVYNVLPYLKECLDSVISQSFPDFEIIIVDDGSTDGSIDLCREYALSDSRITIIAQKNGGVSVARNTGIAASRGEYICFVDADDTLAPDALLRLLEGFECHPSVRVSSGMRNRFKDGTKRYRLMSPLKWYRFSHTIVPPEELQQAYLSESTSHYVTGCLFARELFINESAPMRFKPGIVDEDTLFMYHLANRMEEMGWSMVEIPYVSYNYRIRSGSLSHHHCVVSATSASAHYPLRVYRLRNLDYISDDLRRRGRRDLLPLVLRLRVRTLYCFLSEIRRNPIWLKMFWDEYQRMACDISTPAAARYLRPARFVRFMRYRRARAASTIL